MTTAAHKWDKLRADDWAGLKDRKSEQALVHPKFERRMSNMPTTEAQKRLLFVFSEYWYHNPLSRESKKKKLEGTHQQGAQKPGGFKEPERKACFLFGVRWLREKKCRPGRDDKCRTPGSRAWGTRFPSTHTPVRTPTHPLDMLFFSTFFSRAPNPRHMTFC